MKVCAWILLFTLTLSSLAADLPDWAETASDGFNPADVSADAELVCLLDQRTITLESSSKRMIRHRVVYLVLKNGGVNKASVFLEATDPESRKLVRFQGYHRNQAGTVTRIGRKDVVMVNSSGDELTREMDAVAELDHVSIGSITAFESVIEDKAPMPVFEYTLGRTYPVTGFSIDVAANGVPFEFRFHNMESANLAPVRNGNRVSVPNLPVYAGGINTGWETLPRISLIVDKTAHPFYLSWDDLSRWYHRKVLAANPELSGKAMAALSEKAIFKEAAAQIKSKVSYRQRYLSADRGWTPEKGEEVMRRGYGDCKDMVSCMMLELGKRGHAAAPVLANIGDGARTTSDDAPGPYFNHLIVAVPLAEPMGMDAEVTVNGKSWLLYDPTSPQTPIGKLPAHYRDRSLLICRKEGAAWIDVPEGALVKEGLLIRAGGLLDRDNGLRGTLRITEYGDAGGLRTTIANSNAYNLKQAVRELLDIPAVVEITAVDEPDLEDNRLVQNYQVVWPGFLRHDMDGFRLNRGVAPWVIQDLRGTEDQSNQGIQLDARPPITWRIELVGNASLKPGGDSFDYEDDTIAFSWKAEAGDRLVIEYSSRRGELRADPTQRTALLRRWDRYRRAYDKFSLNVAILRK
ncbi:MAG: hypothetical protein QNK37_14900 [Acidobacteriota bacterium]|nr:hypothetical protein [Acidobacteriota bacterium]